MKNLKNYTRKEINSIYFNYLLDCINLDGRDLEVEPTEPKERLEEVCKAFKSEYVFADNLKRYGNYQTMFQNWIMGLPSILNIDYENYRIIELCEQWGVIPADATEAQTDKVIGNWFNYISNKFFQCCKHYKVDIYTIISI